MANAFDNQSTNQLADDYGTIDLQEKALKSRKDEIKAELIRRNATYAAGERFAVTVSEETRVTVDTKALKEALGPDIIKEYEKVGTSRVCRVKPIAQPLAA